MYFDNPVTVRKLLESDALLRTIIDHVVITPDASIRVLLGSAVFISEIPKIQDLEAIWTIRVTGVPDSELLFVKKTIRNILGNNVEWVDNTLTIRQLATPAMIAEAEQARRQERQQKAFEAAINYAQGLSSGKDGQPGPMGPPGPVGPPGASGKDGKDGRDGLDILATETKLGDLQDVAVTGAQYGDYLMYKQGEWIPATPPRTKGGGSGPVISNGSYQNQPLTWSGTRWSPGSSIQLDLFNSISPTRGQLTWEQDENTAVLGIDGDVHLHLGHDIYAWCRNDTGVDIQKGTAVMFAGTLGASGRVKIAPMIADGTYPGYVFFGITAETIPNGTDGNVISYGKLRGINTSIYTEGAILWCDPSNPGGFTETEPDAPNLKLPVAAVLSKKNNGTLVVRWDTGRRLADLHDVQTSNPHTADVLRWSSTNSRWEHSSVATNNPPATATSTGVAGEIRYDNNYIYTCIATNTWKRSPLSSW